MTEFLFALCTQIGLLPAASTDACSLLVICHHAAIGPWAVVSRRGCAQHVSGLVDGASSESTHVHEGAQMSGGQQHRRARPPVELD